MPGFAPNRMPTLTKNMFEIQQKGWIDTNCKETLRIHHRKVEKLLQQTQILVYWKNQPHQKYQEVLKELIPEIFMDAYISISFASIGLYKQANACLRGELETALRLVYFSTHPVEYDWWKKGSEWYLEAQSKDVWGKEYHYFKQLEEVKNLEKSTSGVHLFSDIKTIFKKLSKFVHGGASSFQTRPGRISPKYLKKEFNGWATNFKQVQKYVNTTLVCGFGEVFKNMTDPHKKEILEVVNNSRYQSAIEKSLNITL